MSSENYVCSISGISAPPSPHEDEILDDQPVGWARVTVAIRAENAAYPEIIDAIQNLTDSQLAQVDPAERAAAEPMARLLARATFASLLAQTPRYSVVTHEVYVSGEQLPGALEALGLEEEEDEQEEEPDEGEEHADEVGV
ncbi:MAG: hypothetical protein Q8P18_33290 [Pseudomonadota bacterium]|nr:hypothetical protein [Pseudomonadota bacterium]